MITIAPVQPARSGNPGVVPPWLQGRPVTPPVPTVPGEPTSPGVDAPPAAPVVQAFAAAELLGSGAEPRALGAGHVGCDHGSDHLGLRGSSAASAAGSGISVAREQQRLDDTVAEVQQRFAELGVRREDGNGPVVARFSPTYGNAAYMVTGDRMSRIPADSLLVGIDTRSNTPFAKAKDVVAHELGHRIVHHMTGGLSYSMASEDRAISESLADTFAALVDDDDWIIGDELQSPIRVMDDPEQLGHPDHVNDLPRVLAPGSEFLQPVQTSTGEQVLLPDWHVVAGIPNKAASIIGDELGRAKLGEIYIKATRDHLRPDREIEGLAVAVMQSAKELYGADSHEFRTTAKAWDAVGVLDLVRDQVGATRGR